MKRKVSKKSKRRLITLGTLSVVAIGYFLLTLVGYVYNYASLKQEEKNLQSELLNLQEQKANLKIEIQKLNDPEYVARYAKQNYLYSSNGEYVLKIDSNEKIQEQLPEKNYSTILIILCGVVIFLLVILVLKRKKKQTKKTYGK